MELKVLFQGADEFWDASKDTAPQAFGGEIPKEAFHHVQPRGARRSEVQVKPRVLFEPGFDLDMFVRGVVTQD